MALPTPTVLGLADGYIPTGSTRYIFAPTVSDLSAFTSAEITAGTDLSKLISALEGWSGTGSTLDFPNAFSRIVPKIPGLTTLDDSSFTLNRDVAGDDGHALFNDGADGTTPTSGVFIIAETGIDNVSKELRGFRVTCTSVKESRDLAAPRTDQVMWAISEIGPLVNVPNA